MIVKALYLKAFVVVALAAPFFTGAANSPIIPGFERLAAAGKTEEAGELLLGELGCVNCHAPSTQTKDQFIAYAGPDLNEAGARLRGDYIENFLANPASVHPGTRMPNLLQGDAKKTEALAAFLTNRQEAKPFQRGSSESGRKLFHTIGCVACHAPEPSFRPASNGENTAKSEAPANSIPLGHIANKYRTGQLARFLLDPLRARPSARMPAIQVSEQEAADLESYLTLGTSAESKVSQDRVAEGRKLFSENRCASCHQLNGTPREFVRALAELKNLNGGCLADSAKSGVPLYTLSESQRAALRAALGAIANAPSLTATQKLERHLNAMNCAACHSPEQSRNIYFTANHDDLGDEGRLPPSLTGAGAKLLPDALLKMITGDGAIRPYMNTRMPNFGADHAKTLASLFTLVDAGEDSLAYVNPGSNGRNALGRDLVGNQGLNCITCHALNGHHSLGIEVLDLVSAPKRLRIDWFRAHMLNPAQFRPGTRMPSFFVDGKSPLSQGKADASHQIEAIWVYLNEAEQTRLPAGLENPEDFLLTPKDRPIVFRTFMKGVGMQAIAVGFPEKRNVAFDSRDSRWALLWKGKFLNAEGTWDIRAAPLAEPLGTESISFPKGPSIALLANRDEPWPAVGAPESFRGFRLDRSGCPTFLYRVGSVEVADTVRPKGQAGLSRKIELRGQPTGECWLLAATGQKVELHDNEIQVDGRWRTSFGKAAPILRKSGKMTEALLPIQLNNGFASIEQEISW